MIDRADNRQLIASAALLCLIVLAVGTLASAHADTLPQNDGLDHLGPATCASSVCHGRVLEAQQSSVLLNEYRTWAKHDRHAGAYLTLLNDESRAIAGKLGLKSAHEADICLDCHADNVPADKRGMRFHIDDGVGCESCHGGAERWLTSHATEGTTHKANLDAGLYPTDDLRARSELCLSCHLGTSDKFATHRIMGAGHPRLVFEMDTFTIRQPEHYRVDDDYRQRKGEETATRRWATGALVTARRYVELLQGELFTDHPLYPEIGLFDCHSCHDSFKDLGWEAQPSTASLGPGQVRLNDSSLLIATVVLSQFDEAKGGELYSLVQALHEASGKDRQSVVEVSTRIAALLEANESAAAGRELAVQKLRAARSSLLRLGEQGEFQDYAGAEQAVMSIDVLSFAIEEPSADVKSTLARMYQVVDDDDGYAPSSLVQEFRAFKALASVQ